MKILLAVIAMLAFVGVRAQTTGPRLSDVEQVQNVVGASISKRLKTIVLLKDLNETTGYVTRLGLDDFGLSSDKKGRLAVTIRYDNVLAISSAKGFVSLVPDPKAAPYGNWVDLKKIVPNALVEVTDRSGVVRSGRFRKSSVDSLTAAAEEKGDEWTVKRADIASVHRLQYGKWSIGDGVAGGIDKGAKIGKDIGKGLGQMRGPISGQPMGDGTGASGAALGAGIGALIGLIKGANGKSDSLKVLVYSQ